MLRDDFLRRTLQITRAAVVAEPGPQPQHLLPAAAAASA